MIATEPANESASEEAVGGHVTIKSEASPLRVFISYSHDSPEHADRVLALADHLRQDGLDSILDQYILGSPDEGWPRWMDRQIRDVDFVLMICTPTYYRRVMGEEQPGVGHGVNWESHLIYQHFYQDGTINTRFLPILLEGGSASDIALPFQGVAHYQPMTEKGYEALYRRLTNQPLTPPPDLGTPKQLPPRARAPLIFGNTPSVPPPSIGAANASYFYAREDERLRRDFETNLALLQQYLRQQGIDVEWHGYLVKSGQKNESHLDTSDIILPLVSPDF